jgi:hypothetical protein
MRGHGPGGVALTVVPGRPPVTQVRPPSRDVEKTLLLAPPPAKFRPDCDVVTIVCPNAKESGSTWVLCAGPTFVYGSSLTGVGSTLPAETTDTKSIASAAATAVVRRPLPLSPLSPTVAGS